MSPEVALSGARGWPALHASGLSSLDGGAGRRRWRRSSTRVGVRFAGDRTVRRLNRDFRGKDKTTDVLSFPGEESPEGRHLGDIVISVPTAERQAASRGAALEEEVKLLLLHGVLHCLGHDHETDAGEMEKLEGRLRRRWWSKR